MGIRVEGVVFVEVGEGLVLEFRLFMFCYYSFQSKFLGIFKES